MNGESEQTGVTVSVDVPARNPRLFRYAATNDVLSVLVDNPHTAFTMRDLYRATEYSLDSITSATAVLEDNGLVTISPKGNKKLVEINRARLDKPDDTIVQIPQPEFHLPVRKLVAELQSGLANVEGIVLFGSVARGSADRRSDIDCFVLVDDSQSTAQRTAHEIADDLSDRRIDGERYEFHVLVESVSTARDHGEKLRPVLATGLTLFETDALEAVKREVLASER